MGHGLESKFEIEHTRSFCDYQSKNWKQSYKEPKF